MTYFKSFVNQLNIKFMLQAFQTELSSHLLLKFLL